MTDDVERRRALWRDAKRRQRAGLSRPRQPVTCGTEGGYRRHLRRREATCCACRDAHAQHRQSQRRGAL